MGALAKPSVLRVQNKHASFTLSGGTLKHCLVLPLNLSRLLRPLRYSSQCISATLELQIRAESFLNHF